MAAAVESPAVSRAVKAAERWGRPPCRARLFLSDRGGTACLGGLAVSARYDAATQSVEATVQNTLSRVLCYVQSEPHLKLGTQTVGELGPDVLGHLSPGQEATSSVPVSSEPSLAGVSYDGYVVSPGGVRLRAAAVPYRTRAGRALKAAAARRARRAVRRAAGATLAPDETFDAVRYGARLIMRYDAANNSFTGSVENTTSGVLTRVRVEVHLSNGTELGPTAEVDLAAGEVLAINLPATAAPFTGWIAHAEVGGGGEGSQSGGEGGGEHGGSGEGSGEHGFRRRGERRRLGTARAGRWEMAEAPLRVGELFRVYPLDGRGASTGRRVL